MGLMQTHGGCSHWGHQWQRQRCHHGMGWVPILQRQWQWQRMGLMESNRGCSHWRGCNGNVNSKKHPKYIYVIDFAVATVIAVAASSSVNTCNDVVAVAVTQCERTFIQLKIFKKVFRKAETRQLNTVADPEIRQGPRNMKSLSPWVSVFS